jgi:hypothetical protein
MKLLEAKARSMAVIGSANGSGEPRWPFSP